MRIFRTASPGALLIALVAVLLGAISPATLLAASTPMEHPLLAVQAWPGNGCSNYGMANGQSSNPYSRVPVYDPYPHYSGSMPCRTSYPPAYGPPSYYPPTCVRAYYIVRPGDNLFRIGLRFGVNWYTLAIYNGIRNPNLIFWGMRLAIPCSNGYAPAGSQGYPSSGYPSGNPQPYQQPQMAPGGGGQSNATIMDFAFNPASMMVSVGQTVVWVNNGPSMHTTTSDVAGWDSGALNPGQSFSHTFTTAGTFTYHCSIHPTMHGTVVVTP